MYGYKKPSLAEVNLVYLVLGFALLIIGYLVQSKEIYSGLLITEYIIILLPNILFLKLRGYKLKRVLRLNSLSFMQFIFIILIMIFAYPVAIFFNAIFLAIINSFSSALPTSIPIPTTSIEYLIGLFVIAIAPGICEEVMFRGTMMSAYDTLGYKKSILITAILFGLFHFNIMNLIGPIFLGVILGSLVHKTNSIYASILGHTLNNAIALTIGFAITKFSDQINDMASTTQVYSDNTQMIMSLVVFGVLAFVSSIVLVFLFKKMPTNESVHDSFDYSGIVFKPERFKILKYVPIIIIIVTFLFLNIRMLFYV